VLIDDGGVDIGYLWACGEPVDYEGVQRVSVRDADVEEAQFRNPSARSALARL